MKKLLAAFVACIAVSASVFATQAEYDRCLKKCEKMTLTPDEKEKCIKFCDYFLQDQ